MRLHQSVMVEEALCWLDPKSGDTIVDGTIGAGGHAEQILERCGPHGRLIGFDKDPKALSDAGKLLRRFGDRVKLMRDDFRNIPNRLNDLGINHVDKMLLDLGMSSMQLDEETRGFSFRFDAPLDMRMDPDGALTAYDIVNAYPKKELENILWQLGEERFSRRIVEKITETRKIRKIKSTTELASLISEAVPGFYKHGRIHPATKSFQALRIAVNDEMGALKSFLSRLFEVLGAKGRVVIISFHSLEDRMVKLAFKEFKTMNEGVILTKKPVTPTETEIKANPRSRSAKLRAFERS